MSFANFCQQLLSNSTTSNKPSRVTTKRSRSTVQLGDQIIKLKDDPRPQVRVTDVEYQPGIERLKEKFMAPQVKVRAEKFVIVNAQTRLPVAVLDFSEVALKEAPHQKTSIGAMKGVIGRYQNNDEREPRAIVVIPPGTKDHVNLQVSSDDKTVISTADKAKVRLLESLNPVAVLRPYTPPSKSPSKRKIKNSDQSPALKA